jgi:hypothetical protein
MITILGEQMTEMNDSNEQKVRFVVVYHHHWLSESIEDDERCSVDNVDKSI